MNGLITNVCKWIVLVICMKFAVNNEKKIEPGFGFFSLLCQHYVIIIVNLILKLGPFLMLP